MRCLVVHGNHNPGQKLRHNLPGFFWADGVGSSYRQEQHIHLPDFLNLPGQKNVPQIAQMDEVQPFCLSDVNFVLSSLGSLLLVVEGAYSTKGEAFTLPGFSCENRHPLRQPGSVCVVVVVVAGGDYCRREAGDRVADRRSKKDLRARPPARQSEENSCDQTT